MYDYILTVKIPIQEMDDPDARAKAQALLKEMSVPEGIKPVMKLQRLEPNKPPVGIAIVL
jgi:hypothetical protein